MIVWLNGPCNGGKSTLAAEPRRALADHVRRPRDYQDLPAWRELTGALVTGLARHTRGPVIAPMTVLNRAYAAELFTSLRQSGGGFHHLVLHTTPEVLQARIEASWEYPGDPERSEAVRAHRRWRAADYYEPPPAGCTRTGT
ncbi:AAA family ATPase [Streptomyces sp. P1-3]|uniref:AAA family ATPase n=1 Tax=Streptomyces sp. P1-3 TaxID=3421658 RepID=UPI003D35B7D6